MPRPGTPDELGPASMSFFPQPQRMSAVTIYEYTLDRA
jgi:hypothetical protein